MDGLFGFFVRAAAESGARVITARFKGRDGLAPDFRRAAIRTSMTRRRLVDGALTAAIGT